MAATEHEEIVVQEHELQADEDRPAQLDPATDAKVSQALAVLEERAAPLVSKIATGDALTVADMVARRDIIKAAMQEAMVPGVHYGLLEGIGKPSLWKPGAEALGVLFKFAPTFPEARTHVDYQQGQHMVARYTCELVHYPTGVVVAEGVGMASTYEAKYRWREQLRVCPNCGKATIRYGKRTEGPDEWYCWRKLEGCGSNFQVGTEAANAIKAQPTGRIENEDLADSWNTVLKQGSKRAYVDATLHATGASDLFTQDAEGAPGNPFGAGSTGKEPPARVPGQQPAQPPQPPPDEWAGMGPVDVLARLGAAQPQWDWRRMLVRAANGLYPEVKSWGALAQLPEADRVNINQRLRNVARVACKLPQGTLVDSGQVQQLWAAAYDGVAIEPVLAGAGAPQPPQQPAQQPVQAELGADAAPAPAGPLQLQQAPTADDYDLAKKVLGNRAQYGADDNMIGYAEQVVAAYEAANQAPPAAPGGPPVDQNTGEEITL